MWSESGIYDTGGKMSVKSFFAGKGEKKDVVVSPFEFGLAANGLVRLKFGRWPTLAHVFVTEQQAKEISSAAKSRKFFSKEKIAFDVIAGRQPAME